MLLLLMLCVAHARRRRVAAAALAAAARTKPDVAAMAIAISQLPTHACSSDELGAECAICLGELELGQTLKALPCGHAYHGPCIDRWLLGKCTDARAQPTCPLCKAAALPPPPATEDAAAPAAGVARLPAGQAEAPAEDGVELQEP